ncbi:phosphotransferase enzyme family protein [Brachybacterium tyrofermentans]|uniref:phosphotransferase enzyme family protein n=1 Tax=Brachybacterium tyrofermentans TaxID=47848 RepID=UPI003FD5227F
MLTPDEGLRTEWLAQKIQDHWGISVATITNHLAGQGSHNFVVRSQEGRRWFVKVNRIGPNSEFFLRTYETAGQLRDQGLDFVSAALRSRSGELLPDCSKGWQIGVFPFIEGRNLDLGNDRERALLAATLGQLHGHKPLPVGAIRWDPTWLQPELRQILTDGVDHPWSNGPFGEPARKLLLNNRHELLQLITLSEKLVARTFEDGQPFVATHGEPHGGNVMIDHADTVHLIDCDAMFLAPRERDLRLLLYGSHRRPRDIDNGAVIAAYRQMPGTALPRAHTLEAFRAEWHLIEVTRYAQMFSRPHVDSTDTRSRWRALNSYVPVSKNWGNIAAYRFY